MYQTATKARETRLNHRTKTAKDFMDAMKVSSGSFRWGSVLSNITVGANTYYFLRDVKDLDTENVRAYTA